MGLWLKPEDIDEALSDRFGGGWTGLSDWADESREIYGSINKVRALPTGQTVPKDSKHERRELISFLLTTRDTLQYRLNLILSVQRFTNTSLFHSMASGLKYKMENALSTICEQLENEDSTIAVSTVVSEEKKLETKRILILQILNQVKLAINNAKTITAAELKPIRDDISLMISWFYDKRTGGGSIPDERKINDFREITEFYTRETGKNTKECRHCGNITTSFMNKCLACGKKIGD